MRAERLERLRARFERLRADGPRRSVFGRRAAPVPRRAGDAGRAADPGGCAHRRRPSAPAASGPASGWARRAGAPLRRSGGWCARLAGGPPRLEPEDSRWAVVRRGACAAGACVSPGRAGGQDRGPSRLAGGSEPGVDSAPAAGAGPPALDASADRRRIAAARAGALGGRGSGAPPPRRAARARTARVRCAGGGRDRAAAPRGARPRVGRCRAPRARVGGAGRVGARPRTPRSRGGVRGPPRSVPPRGGGRAHRGSARAPARAGRASASCCPPARPSLPRPRPRRRRGRIAWWISSSGPRPAAGRCWTSDGPPRDWSPGTTPRSPRSGWRPPTRGPSLRTGVWSWRSPAVWRR